MIKILIALFFLFPSLLLGHDHSPPAEVDGGFSQRGMVRLFYKTNHFSNMLEYGHSGDVNTRKENSLTLGTRYRLHRNFKIGAFFSRRQGQRHDDDWIDDGSGNWFWRNTNNRSENYAILELAPRFLADFLPGKKWVFEFRIRGENNFDNKQNTLKLKPGLTYFWFKEGKPFMNLFLQYEAYLPLNYGEETIYETWIYTGLLFHWSERFKPGLFFTKYNRKWTTSARARAARPTQPYLTELDGSFIGVNLNINFH